MICLLHHRSSRRRAETRKASKTGDVFFYPDEVFNAAASLVVKCAGGLERMASCNGSNLSADQALSWSRS